MIRLGTRGSALALAQARMTAERLGGEVEIVEITTTGDRDRALPDKEKWVRELDRALVDGEIDLAVHSAKDVPGVLADGIALVAALPREDPRDALVGALNLEALRRVRGWARAVCGAPDRCSRCAPTCRSCRCAAMSIRACASSPRVRSMPRSSRRPG